MLRQSWTRIFPRDLVRRIASALKRIIHVIIDLFRTVSDKNSTPWTALAFAKECMEACIEFIVSAKDMCAEAKEKALMLADRAAFVKNQPSEIGDVDRGSIKAIRELSGGTEIKDAVNLAKGMGNLVLETVASISAMIDKVSKGYQSLPDILAVSFELEESGKADKDPGPVDFEENVQELDGSKEELKTASVEAAPDSGVRGFEPVESNSLTCRELLDSVTTFATDCHSVIASFMDAWDLSAAASKIRKTRRIVRLGEIIVHFANQIKRVAVSMIDLIESATSKLWKLDFGFDDLQEAISDKLKKAGCAFCKQPRHKIQTFGIHKPVR